MRNEAFHGLLKEMAEIHDRKNADYATSSNPYSNFEEAAAAAGCSVDTVFLVLLGVKQARLRVLLASGKPPNNESVLDSKRDLAVYAALWASYDEWRMRSAQNRAIVTNPSSEKEWIGGAGGSRPGSVVPVGRI